MKFKAIREVSSKLCGWEFFETIPQGAICEVRNYMRIPAIFYKGKAVCDIDSQMCKEYFEEVVE